MTEGDSGWAGELLRALGGEEIKNFGFCPIIIVWKYVWDGRIPPTRQAAPLRTRGMLISIVTPENFGGWSLVLSATCSGFPYKDK